MLKIKDLISVNHVEQINFNKLKKKNYPGVTIDSRSAKQDEIFFAIKGDRTDGHKYIKEVFKKGISIAVVNAGWFRKEGEKFKGKVFLTVNDTTPALGEFAKIHKSNFDIPVMCIGGSNGKTTTKDLTAAVLSQKYKVLRTEGNFNNHIGLPLTLLRLKKTHEFCLLEVGCNHFGEIKYLCGIAEPDFGLLTNIGREHLEFFGDIKGVAKAEFELFDYLKKKNKSVIFFNYDDKYIKNYSGGTGNEKKFSYSYEFNTDVKGRFKGYNEKYEPEIKIEHGKKEFTVTIATFGKHSVYNGLAAAAVGLYFKVDRRKIADALRKFRQASAKRMEIVRTKKMTVINDTYNSNPESVMMGIETILGFETKGEKFAVLSDMLELGKSSSDEHSKIGRFVKKKGLKNLYTYGRESFKTFYNAKGVKNNFYFENKEDMIRMLNKNLGNGDIVYVKGSRGMQMEEVVKGISNT